MNAASISPPLLRACFADRQHRRQGLHRRLAGDQPQPLAQFDRAAGDAVEHRRGARVVAGPASRIDRGAAPGRRSQPLAQPGDFRPLAAGEDHPQRIEQYQLGVPPHRLRDVGAARLGDEPRQFLDLFSHAPTPDGYGT